MKKMGRVSLSFGWRASPALIDEGSECYRAQRRLFITSCHGHNIGDKAMKVRMPHSELKWEIPNNSNSRISYY
jgi:hypothetical protein